MFEVMQLQESMRKKKGGLITNLILSILSSLYFFMLKLKNKSLDKLIPATCLLTIVQDIFFSHFDLSLQQGLS